MTRAVTANKTPASEPKRRGQKRSKAADEAILKATLEELVEKGYAHFSVNKVIARAGVSSATLYRRWGTVQELITAALRSIGREPVTIDTGSFEGDLAAFVEYLGDTLTPHDLSHVATTGARVDAQLRKAVLETFVSPRKEILAAILQRARERGELTNLPPIDDCWSYVSGPIHHRIYIRGEKFTRDFSRTLTELLIAGFRTLTQN